MVGFVKATRKRSFLRMALDGPTGAGKTFTALRFAYAFKGAETKVGVINSESGAVEKYQGLSPDGIVWDFDVLTLEDFSPTSYTAALEVAARYGFDVVIIDSLSHAWAGSGGALELLDKSGNNKMDAWRKITPMHNRLVEAIVRSPFHLIATMRSKMEYLIETRPDGRTNVKKVGLKPVQREGMEYEFDVVADIDQETHTLTVSKTRCPAIDGKIVVKPGIEFVQPLVEWLSDGIAVPAPAPIRTEQPVAQPASQPQPPAGGAKASDAQIARIKELGFQFYDGDGDAFKAFFAKNGIKSAELTPEKADAIIAAFEAKIAAKAPPAASSEPAPGSSLEAQPTDQPSAGELTSVADTAAFLKVMETFETDGLIAGNAIKLYREVHGYTKPSEIPEPTMRAIATCVPVVAELEKLAAVKGFSVAMFLTKHGRSHLWDVPFDTLTEQVEQLRDSLVAQPELATAGN